MKSDAVVNPNTRVQEMSEKWRWSNRKNDFVRSTRSTTAYGPLLRFSGRTPLLRLFYYHVYFWNEAYIFQDTFAALFPGVCWLDVTIRLDFQVPFNNQGKPYYCCALQKRPRARATTLAFECLFSFTDEVALRRRDVFGYEHHRARKVVKVLAGGMWFPPQIPEFWAATRNDK